MPHSEPTAQPRQVLRAGLEHEFGVIGTIERREIRPDQSVDGLPAGPESDGVKHGLTARRLGLLAVHVLRKGMWDDMNGYVHPGMPEYLRVPTTRHDHRVRAVQKCVPSGRESVGLPDGMYDEAMLAVLLEPVLQLIWHYVEHDGVRTRRRLAARIEQWVGWQGAVVALHAPVAPADGLPGHLDSGEHQGADRFATGHGEAGVPRLDHVVNAQGCAHADPPRQLPKVRC